MTTMGVNGVGMMFMPMPMMQGARSMQGEQPTQSGEAFQLPPAPPGSPAEQLMGYLSRLETSAPDAFKETATQIAGRLEQAASDAGTGRTSDFLTFLSGKFTQAAEDGNLSAFGPPPGPPPARSQGQMQGMGPAMPQGARGAGGPQDFISQLQQLNEEDSTLFESLMQSVADMFDSAGMASSSNGAATLLNNLSARFTYAAGTGDVSIFQQQPMRNGIAAYQLTMPGNMNAMPPNDGVDHAAVRNIMSDILKEVKSGA